MAYAITFCKMIDSKWDGSACIFPRVHALGKIDAWPYSFHRRKIVFRTEMFLNGCCLGIHHKIQKFWCKRQFFPAHYKRVFCKNAGTQCTHLS